MPTYAQPTKALELTCHLCARDTLEGIEIWLLGLAGLGCCCVASFHFRVLDKLNLHIDRFFTASDDSSRGSLLNHITCPNDLQTVHIARICLALVVFVPLILTPFNGFMLASGLGPPSITSLLPLAHHHFE